MKGSMKAFYAEAEWAPKPEYAMSERERRDRRSYRADLAFKNVRAGLADRPIPAIGNDEVLIRIGACGICGSDLHTLDVDAAGYSSFASHVRFPVITGHEYSGEVVEIGKDVASLRVGDLVAVEQIGWCGACRPCRAGKFNQCENIEEAGLSCDGGFVEYGAVREKFCIVINSLADALGGTLPAFEAGALAEPTCVAYNGMVVNAGGVTPGSHVVVFGAGPIGLAAIALAKALGAAKIIAFSTNHLRNALAATMGADVVLNPTDLATNGTSAGQAVMKETGGLGADMIVEASGNLSNVYPEISRCLGVEARVVQLGIGPAASGFDLMPFVRRNAKIIGSMGHAGNNVFPSVLRMMAAGRLDMRRMVTARYPLSETAAGIAASGKRELGHGKILVSQHYRQIETSR
ncbi:MAG: alcohol dehydrogenase catalytic domain-containing protein [Planctomycetes bacterium]|nr:alcohol dehydrogenase catalytic domain-containing protein [Planctomycetota bacterium]